MKGVIKEKAHAHTFFTLTGMICLTTCISKTEIKRNGQRCLAVGPVCIPNFITV
jgi:hypothetical protein